MPLAQPRDQIPSFRRREDRVAVPRSINLLWASDYIQTLRGPSQYANEVISAARAAGFAPDRVAAEHLVLSEWQKVLDAQKLKTEQPKFRLKSKKLLRQNVFRVY